MQLVLQGAQQHNAYTGMQRVRSDLQCPAGMLGTLQEMLTGDKDAQVVANCMSVLQQVRAASSMCSLA